MDSANTGKIISILLAEDNSGDAQLVRLALRRRNPADQPSLITHCVRLADAVAELDKKNFDVVLLDLTLPDTAGLEGVAALRSGFPEIPIVVLSGMSNEATAAGALENGAQDFLSKDHMNGPTLLRSIRHATDRRRIELERDGLARQLEEALTRNQSLAALLPLCADCRRNANERGTWVQLQTSLHVHGNLHLNEGICPVCSGKVFHADLLDS